MNVWNAYTFFRCRGCDLEFVEPRENPSPDWYENRDDYALQSCFEREDGLAWYHRQFFHVQPRLTGPVLDIGCGTGSFLAEAKRCGYDVHGIDFNRQSIAKAREKYGLQYVQATSIDDALKDPGYSRAFPIVTFFEVLEHQAEPDVFMGQVKKFLSPNGVICLSVPNRDRRPNFFLEVDFPPHHFTRWSKRALRNFLARHNFEITHFVVAPVQMHLWLSNWIRLGVGRRLIQTGTAAQLASPCAPIGSSAGGASSRGCEPPETDCLTHTISADSRRVRRHPRLRFSLGTHGTRAIAVASRLYRIKENVLKLIGVPLDVIMKPFGAEGHQMFVAAKYRG